MRGIILILLLATAPIIWAAQLSPAMDQPGDFLVIDKKREIQFVGRFEMDFSVFFRTYADGKKEQGKAPFAIGQYRAGKIVATTEGVMGYSISDDRIVFSFSPDVQDAGLNFIIHFDPSNEVSFGEASEGNVAGPKRIGTAHVRFKKREPKHTAEPGSPTQAVSP